MTRLLILLAIGAITFGVLSSGPPDGTAPADASPAAASGALTLPGLDLLSLCIGLVAGLIIGWIWNLPWRTAPELFREVVVRSIRGVGLIGLAMGAAAVLLFY